MRKLLVIGVACILLFMLGFPGYAASWQVKSGVEIIDNGQVIEGDLWFHGDRLEVNGIIKGDLIVSANEVIINGRVDGDLLGVIWQKASLKGLVQGNFRGFAYEVSLTGKINGSMTIIALSFNSIANSWIEKGVLGTYSVFNLQGTVNGPVDIYSNYAAMSGRVNDNLKFHGGKMVWKAPAEIRGRVIDYSGNSNDPTKIDGIKISGGYQMREDKVDLSGIYQTLMYIEIVWFIGSLLTTLVLFRLFPRTFWMITDPSPNNFRKSLLTGLLSFIAIPILGIIFALTWVGIPLAILLGLVFILLLLFSGIPLNLWFGRLLFKSPLHPSFLIILGGVFLLLISFIPVVNALLFFVFLWLGFGMIISNIKPQCNEGKRIDVKL